MTYNYSFKRQGRQHALLVVENRVLRPDPPPRVARNYFIAITCSTN